MKKAPLMRKTMKERMRRTQRVKKNMSKNKRRQRTRRKNQRTTRVRGKSWRRRSKERKTTALIIPTVSLLVSVRLTEKKVLISLNLSGH